MSSKSRSSSEPDYVACDACKLSPICNPVDVGGHSYDFTGHMVHRRHFFKKGTFIFSQGEPAELVYAISAGTVKLIAEVKDSRRVVDFRIPGELVDISSLIEGVHTYSAQALEDIYLCEIGKETLVDIASQIPQVQGRLMNVVNKELASIQKSALFLHGNVNAEEKIAAFVLNLAWRYSLSGYLAESFKLTMTRTDIADYLGLSKETVIRLFKKLEQAELLKVEGKQLTIKNMDNLQNFVGIHLISAD